MNDVAELPASHLAENEPTRAFLAQPDGPLPLDTSLDGYKRFRAWFTRPILTRPAILDAAQTRQLDHDLPLLLRTLQSLPQRLFGGDEQAFAQAVGWRQPSAVHALRHLSGPPVPLGRADLVRGPAGFQMVEFNTSSSLGSLEFGVLCEAVLTDGAFSGFARSERLYYVDPLTMLVDTLLDVTGLDPTDHPVIAIADWPTTPVVVNASLFGDLLTDMGFQVVACTVNELEFTRDGLYCGDLRVDAIYRSFLLKELADDATAPELLQPVVEAVRTGAVRLFSPVNADLYGTKTCMALLSDDAHRDKFTAEELEVADRVLPWTRAMTGALTEYVLGHRDELLIKPAMGHAGRGVIAGWLVSPREWAEHVRAAARGHCIVQRRVHSVAERFPGAGPHDPPSACFLHWGMFVTGRGLSGGFIKGLPDRVQDVRYLGDGSHVGCIFHSMT